MSFIRPVQMADAARILEIYAPFISAGPVTFETSRPSLAEFEQRVQKISAKYPYLVWDENGLVLGYAYASLHRERAAYRWAVETSIYLAPEARGKGIGSRLYNALLDEVKACGFTIAYGIIAMPNDASVALHSKCGFSH